jgi:8-oxo-dGTP diphosphatase
MPSSEQGVNRERYMLVPRTLVFITQGDNVLLLKGARDKRLWAGLYNGVGGHIEQGEDVLSAARRELWEETSLNLKNLWLCGTLTIDTGINPGVVVFVFRGESSPAEPLVSREGTSEWFEVSELMQLPLVSDLPALLPKILNMVKGDVPFSAHSWYDETGKLTVTFG